MGSLLRVVTEASPQALRVLAEGEVDIASVDELTAALLAAEQTDVPQIVLDLSGVTFLDSAGVLMLLQANTRSRAKGERLRVLTSPAVDRVIDLCQLRDKLPLS